jgi:hypothetical protein
MLFAIARSTVGNDSVDHGTVLGYTPGRIIFESSFVFCFEFASGFRVRCCFLSPEVSPIEFSSAVEQPRPCRAFLFDSCSIVWR